MKVISVSDLRDRARRRLPRPVFDFIDGGAGLEAGILRNTRAFEQILLEPRALVNVETRDISVQIFGRSWAAPFGVAPIGLGNLIWPKLDEAIAFAAAAANIPYTLSTAGTTSLERIAEIAPGRAWFQLYPSGREDTDDIVDRAERAGYEVLLVTVDCPLPARRLRDIRNQFAVPLKMTPSALLELVKHPRWTINTIASGSPRMVNISRYNHTISASFDWIELGRLRKRWPHKLVLKGLVRVDDCIRARDAGCDAVIISNHGGRQLDSAPATIDVLPFARRAVGTDFPLIIDSGIRSGEHIVKALAAGADFVMIGRAIIYAVAAYGPAAASEAISLLIDETSRCLGQIGFGDVRTLRQFSPVLTPAKYKETYD